MTTLTNSNFLLENKMISLLIWRHVRLLYVVQSNIFMACYYFNSTRIDNPHENIVKTHVASFLNTSNLFKLLSQKNNSCTLCVPMFFESPTAQFASQCILFRAVWPDRAKGLYHRAFWPSSLFILTLQVQGPCKCKAQVCQWSGSLPDQPPHWLAAYFRYWLCRLSIWLVNLPKRPVRFKICTIVRIELNCIQAIEVVSVVRVVCDSLSSVSIWSSRSSEHFFETTGTIWTIIWKPGFSKCHTRPVGSPEAWFVWVCF